MENWKSNGNVNTNLENWKAMVLISPLAIDYFSGIYWEVFFRFTTLYVLLQLLDSETIYTRMFEIMAGRYGRTFTWELKVKQMGRNHNDAAQIFIGK